MASSTRPERSGRPTPPGKTRSLQDLRRARRREGAPREDLEHARPQTRGQCAEGPRPCPFVGCRHHLGLEVKRVSLRFPWGDDEGFLQRMPETCSLDVADRGEHQSMEVAELLGLSRQCAGQVEMEALTKLKRALRRQGGSQMVRALRESLAERLHSDS